MKELSGDALRTKLVAITSNESLRNQAESLKGRDAVVLCDLIHEVSSHLRAHEGVLVLMIYDSA